MSENFAELQKHAMMHREKASENHHKNPKHYEAGYQKATGYYGYSPFAHHLLVEEYAKHAARYYAEHRAR